MSAARVALYYAPEADDPLAYAAATWLGRDAETNAPMPQPDIPGIAEATADPRRYGFHATLRPPFRLAPGATWDDIAEAIEALAARTASFALPRLSVVDVHGFLALRETEPCPELHALADDAVRALDRFRAPPSEAELARRRAGGLTPEQEKMLVRWGYPHVFGTWFFHMTLTRRLDDAERARFLPAAQAHFAQCLSRTREIASVCLFTQSGPDMPFTEASRVRLGP